MKYLSVCSGIEAATVAWHQLGWEPVGFAEIEPFPAAVLAHHYPAVKNLGDMTNYKEWDLGTVDLLVGGTPCQSFSVAGLRKGLADPRGNLALVYCGILDHFRPQWCVWENVPGVLSSNGGRDFGSFLGALAELGYGFAYRVLDAQYFGVAQRRRRVFVVGHLGDWRAAAEVLFEPESLRRDTAPSRKKGKVTPTLTKAGTGVSRTGHNEHGWYVETPVIAGSLDTECGGGKLTHQSVANGHLIGTITARMFQSLGARDVEEGAVMPATKPIALADISSRDKSQNGSGWKDDGTMYTLDTTGLQGVAQPIPLNTMNVMRSPDAAASTGCGVGEEGEAMFTLTKGNSHAVAQPIGAFKSGQGAASRSIGWSNAIAPTLPSNAGGNTAPAVLQSMAVRRLTPVECERLQGFPDGYTNIPWRKQPESPDGPRYKALGNSMAVPVMGWIGKRIQIRVGA